ncbi:MAG: GTP cyclohydrolase [Bacteroidota bacterium]
MKPMKFFRNYQLMTILSATLFIVSCSDDDEMSAPPEEEELEVITDVTLVFTDSNGTAVRASANDPDGEGVQGLVVADPISLSRDMQYTLTFEIFNNLETPGEDIGEEIQEEDDEHQFFFSFTTDAFDSPMGNGNVDTASDPVNYDDRDENGNAVGLETTWTTPVTPLAGGNFTVLLKHQPGVKTSTSTSEDGDTDFNLSFVLNIQ